jgi:hypothetical protein
LTPLTTYTYTTSTADTNTVSATDIERLPPGGFSLRHGFPQWFGSHRKASLESTRSPQSSISVATHGSGDPSNALLDVAIYDLLEYLRMAFSSEELLSTIPVEAAANPGAYHAFRAFKGLAPVSHSRTTSPEPSSSRARKPGEWNWEGVWEERVKRGVQSTLTESMLFGGASAADDVVRVKSFWMRRPPNSRNPDPLRRNAGRDEPEGYGTNAHRGPYLSQARCQANYTGPGLRIDDS